MNVRPAKSCGMKWISHQCEIMRIVLEIYFSIETYLRYLNVTKKDLNLREQSYRGESMSPTTSKKELFAIIDNSFHLLTILAKSPISDLTGFFDRHLYIRKRQVKHATRIFQRVEEI